MEVRQLGEHYKEMLFEGQPGELATERHRAVVQEVRTGWRLMTAWEEGCHEFAPSAATALGEEPHP